LTTIPEMKSILSVLVAVLMVTVVDTAQGCNVCGCGVGTNHHGILPQFQKNFVGVRYHNKTYRSHLGMEHAAMYSNEHFQSVELWARFYPAKRVQVFAFLPYKINERTEGSDVLRLRGIGDASVSVNYSLINTYDSALATLRHNLMIGGGVKLPTGNFQARSEEHTSELQSRENLVCRLLLEKKKQNKKRIQQ